MTQYRDEKNGRIVDETTGEPLGSLPYEAEEDLIVERQRGGMSPWGVVGAGIIVILIAAAGFAMWQPSATTEPASTASTQTAPINAAPAGQGAVDNNTATGSIKPPETVETKPAPAGDTNVAPALAPQSQPETAK